MTAASTTVPAELELDRLHQALSDVRFLLERGAWQSALATARAALARDEDIKLFARISQSRRP